MNILFFIHSLSSGGAERVTVTLANYWAAKGWEVIIVTVTEEDRDFYPLHPAVRRIALGLDGASGGSLEGIANNWRRMRALRGVLGKEQPAIAIAFMPTANVLLSLAAVGLGIPTIGSERTYPPKMPLGGPWERARRYTYGHLTSLVAQTALSAQWLAENTTAKRDRIVVIPNPVTLPMLVNEPRFSLAESLQSIGCSRILLAVGRLGPEKGFDRLIDAFVQLSGQHPEWGLVILGEGGQRAALEEQCRASGLESRVRLPGAVGNVGECYQAADLYVLTSRFEGFPNTLMEALAHGLPAVAVDCETGPREILRHEVDGLLVPQDDHTALLGALKRLMADDGLRDHFSERAVEARHRFAVERVAKMWEELFSNV
ncbi:MULTISPECIES: glycosyltransferase family 4 protein [Marinobacter]|uniref:glycosyltransferase family 4 protein n=1 Tax=Marinobacter TaxID=2742 RepID=UPI0032640A56